jgi:hypothetical protein
MGGFNYGSIINEAWGWPDDSIGLIASFAGAANITIGANPPYSAIDFLSIYPKFLGTPLRITMAVTSGSPNATLPVADARLLPGQLVTGPDIPAGTSIVSNSGTAVVLSANATATNATEATQVYAFPLVPLAVLNVYINLASASIMQSRYQDGWALAMALYIAHFVTLWLQSDGTPATNAAQAAQQGMARGIQVSKSVGDTSVSFQPLQGIEDWGAWNLTMYGLQFATMARVIGSGPMVIW